MAQRFFVYGLVLTSMSACDTPSQTYTIAQDLRKEVIEPNLSLSCHREGQATVNLSVKFDKTPHNGERNIGQAYYRVDIANPSDYRLSVNSIYVEFKDEMEISIRKCRLHRNENKFYGDAPIMIRPGAVFSASGHCDFPISQMDLIREPVALVGFGFFGG